MKRLKRENAELKRANAILKAASAFFAAELDRPGTDRGVHRRARTAAGEATVVCDGVSSRSARCSPSTGCRSPRRPTTSRPRRRPRDAGAARRATRRCWPRSTGAPPDNYGVYGARKVWLTLNRDGHRRRPVHRGAADGASRADRCPARARSSGPRSPTRPRTGRRDLVDRDFSPTAPNRLWVADFTYVSTWAGWVYVAFVIDAYARRILGWRAATSMTTPLVLDALEQAVWTRARTVRPTWTGWSTTTMPVASRIQPVVATPDCWSESRCSSRASAGVFQPRVLRGRQFKVAATASMSCALHRDRSVPLGKYWRSKPLVFSFVPRCHGLGGRRSRPGCRCRSSARHGRRVPCRGPRSAIDGAGRGGW